MLIIVAVQFQYLVVAKASCHVVSRTDSSQLNDFTLFYKMSRLKRFLEKFSLEISTLSPRDSLGLLVCCRAHFSVLETVDAV